MDYLPNELIMIIASYLNIDNIRNYCQINHRLDKLISNNNHFWEEILYSHVFIENNSNRIINFKKQFKRPYKEILAVLCNYKSITCDTPKGKLVINFMWDN